MNCLSSKYLHEKSSPKYGLSKSFKLELLNLVKKSKSTLSKMLFKLKFEARITFYIQHKHMCE